MKLFAILTGAAVFALASADSASTSISTLTNTRTVFRVATATMTGSANGTYTTTYSTGSVYRPTANVTMTATGKSSPTVQTYNPSATNAAPGLSIDLAVAAIVGGAAMLAL